MVDRCSESWAGSVPLASWEIKRAGIVYVFGCGTPGIAGWPARLPHEAVSQLAKGVTL